MFGFVVVDDGVIADVGNGFVVLVNGSVLGVNVGQVGAVVLVDVAVPGVVVDGDVGLLFDRRFIGDNGYYNRVEIGRYGTICIRGLSYITEHITTFNY